MRRGAYTLASTACSATFLAACVAACNALTGVSDLSPCARCELDGASPHDATADTELVKLDGSTTADARDGASATDATVVDAGKDAVVDAGVDAAIGCQGAVACERVVFVTSLDFNGALGGVAGADSKCQGLADASTIARIKGRTFLAWVSTTTTSPAQRFTHGSMPYVMGDGRTIASSWADLTDGSLMNGIDHDELGGTRSNSAWTSTTSANASFTGQACADWTSALLTDKGRYGNVGGPGNGWSSSGDDDCDIPNALYCFEK